MSRLRLLCGLFAAGVLALLVALWLLPPQLEGDRYRAAVTAIASAGLGRPVRIEGALHVSLLPRATLRAERVSFIDTGDGVSASAAEMRLRVALWPLLAGRVEPRDLVLEQPQIHLPWPLAGFILHGAPSELHARVEGGTLTLGNLPVTGIEGEIALDPASGGLAASGTATLMGRTWHMTGRLGRADAEGAASVQASLDGQGSVVGTGASLSGEIEPTGNLTGRIAGRGPDLSLLAAAPPVAWRAEGRITAGSGLVVADDLELAIGGAPGRGAVALRLLPQLRLDAALATSRLDGDAWLAAIANGRTGLPTGIDLSAEAVPLAGGTLRQMRVGFEVGTDGVALREAEAVLPGDAALHLSGQLAAGHFTGEARLSAPDLPSLFAWLRPRTASPAGALLQALPAMVQQAELSATLDASTSQLALHGIQGQVDGTGLHGNLALRGGEHPAVAAVLQLDGPALDALLPGRPASLAEALARWNGLPAWLARFDADLAITASHPRLGGQAFDSAEFSALVTGGALTLRRAALAGPPGQASLSGVLRPDGQVSGGRLSLAIAQAAPLAAWLPASVQPLFQGPASLAANLAGPASALQANVAAEVSDARAQATGTLDLPGRGWRGQLALHHPGAPRLLLALGLGKQADWLGEGSLSLQADVQAAPDRVAARGIALSAGSLRAGGDLALSGLPGAPALSGHIDADTLPLPALQPHGTEPWPVGSLQGASAALAVHAAHVLLGDTALDDASAKLTLNAGSLVLDGVSARLAGGTLAGHAALDTAATPPRLSLAGTLTGAAAGGTVPALAGGQADVTAALGGTGFSPAAVLATLAGTLHVHLHDGALAGLDAGAALFGLSGTDPAAAATAALSAGGTPYSQLDLPGTVASGVWTVPAGTVTAPSGRIDVAGSLDLSAESVDAHVALHPAMEGAPVLGLRLIGPIAAPERTPELADLARWLAGRS